MGLEIKKRSTVVITLFDRLAKGNAVFLKVLKAQLVPRIDIAATER